jgi:hypothetical protein
VVAEEVPLSVVSPVTFKELAVVFPLIVEFPLALRVPFPKFAETVPPVML